MEELVIKNIIPIVTGVKMSDYLSETIKRNRKYFEHYYVITSPDDIETKNICDSYLAKVIEFDNFFMSGTRFNKAGGIFYAQQQIHKQYPDHWILLLDVDIIIPKECVNMLHEYSEKLNTKFLYSVNRYDVYNNSELESGLKSRKYPLNFVGYFQLYYNKSMFYPSQSNNAGQCDDIFFHKFKDKQMLQSYVYHLGKDGSHWFGKTTNWTG